MGARGFQGLSPWMADSILWGLRTKSCWKCVAEESTWEHGTRKQGVERLFPSPVTKYKPQRPVPYDPPPPATPHLPMVTTQLIPTSVNALTRLRLSYPNCFTSKLSCIISHMSFGGTPHI